MSRVPIYRGRVVDFGLEQATLPDGRRLTLEIIRHPGASAVVPLHADGTVTLLSQHRHAGGGMMIEIPAGVLEPGEAPAACAARELSEEAQLAGTLTPLADILTTPGFTDERIHLFLATDLVSTDGHPEDDEYLRTLRVPLQEALTWIDDGRITDAKTICALLLTARRRG